jgi:hypothetical protein
MIADRYKVVTSAGHKRGAGLPLGTVRKHSDGWRFIPAFQAYPSRRGWPTPYEALDGRVDHYTLQAAE